MSLLGKEFDEAMKQLKITLINTEAVIINLNRTVLKMNEIVNKINATLK